MGFLRRRFLPSALLLIVGSRVVSAQATVDLDALALSYTEEHGPAQSLRLTSLTLWLSPIFDLMDCRWKPPTSSAFLVDAGLSDTLARRALSQQLSVDRFAELAETPAERLLLEGASAALARVEHLPVAAPSLFEFRAHNRLGFYSFVNFYLTSPRIALLYTLAVYGPSGCAGFPGLRDLTLAEALFWPQLAAIRLLRAFAPRSPILSSVGIYSEFVGLLADWAAVLALLTAGLGAVGPAAVAAASKTARQLAYAVVWRVLWPVLPWWLCDLWFVWLYLSTTFAVALQLWGQLSALISLLRQLWKGRAVQPKQRT